MRAKLLIMAMFALPACESRPELLARSGRISLDAVPYVYGSDAVIKCSIDVTGERWEAVRAAWGEPKDAVAERCAISRAVGVLEQAAGDQLPTWQDRPRSHPVFGSPGQLDCISESTNTTTFLVLLAQEGLLTRHDVMHPQFRHQYVFFDPHRTAIVQDRETGRCFAVDSWDKFNGEAAMIQDLAAWRRKETPSPFESYED